jgi:multidrug efflux pump subunit AcrB
VPGVKKINILGERPEQIFVEFSYAKLATLGVSAQDIVAALQRQNTVTPAGSIDTQGPQVFIGSTALMTASRRSPTRRSSLRGGR